MAKCIIRTHLPLNASKVPVTTNTGHFDIQVMDIVIVAINGVFKAYTNPIISYNSDGVSIYDEGGYAWENSRMLCTMSFNTNKVNKLEEWLDTYCTISEENNIDDDGNVRDLFVVTSGGFQNYSYATHSCFAATAEWCDLMGYSTLKSIYNNFTYPNGSDNAPDNDGYLNYLAWPIFRTYYKYWTFEKLHAD